MGTLPNVMPDTQKAMDKLVSDMDSHLLLTHKEDHLKATDNNPPFLSSGNGLNPTTTTTNPRPRRGVLESCGVAERRRHPLWGNTGAPLIPLSLRPRETGYSPGSWAGEAASAAPTPSLPAPGRRVPQRQPGAGRLGEGAAAGAHLTPSGGPALAAGRAAAAATAAAASAPTSPSPAAPLRRPRCRRKRGPAQR